MKRHLSINERKVLELIRQAPSYILISENEDGEFRIHQQGGREKDRFIFIFEPNGSGKVKLHAAGYPNEGVIAHRLMMVLKEMYKDHQNLPTLEGKKLILGPDGRIVADESVDPV